MIERAAGERIAAPRPWPAREAKSIAALPAIAEANDEAVKMPRPVEEHAAAAEEVGGAAAEQQEASEDQRVARDRPADLRATQLQVRCDVRQRDVHGRDVEDDHQLRDEQHREKPAVSRGASVCAVYVVVLSRAVVLRVLRLVVHDLTPFKSDVTV